MRAGHPRRAYDAEGRMLKLTRWRPVWNTVTAWCEGRGRVHHGVLQARCKMPTPRDAFVERATKPNPHRD